MDYKEKEYKVFELFDKNWAIVSSGDINNFNCCTLSWGSLGNIWGKNGKSISTVTIYVHPARYTSEFLKENDYFTISFFPEEYKKALAYIGSHSGRDEDKVSKTCLNPIEFNQGVTYKEANLSFLCKKLYQHQFSKDDLSDDIKEYYASMPNVYPDFNGGWQPHIVFVGEIVDVIDKDKNI